MIKCTFSQLKTLLPLYIKADKPVILWGAPGEGKSGFIRSIVEKMEYDLQDFRLLMRDAVDIHGLPKMNEAGRMGWALPEEMPLASDNITKPRVMFLDELPAAPTNVQTVAYQMLHERAIDNVKLHENVRFIAAGNRERDGAVSNRMPTPLANRMAHFDVQADIKSFLEWGHQKGIHPFVLAHLENSPQDLRVSDEKEYTTSKAFRSPRAWEYASDVIHEAMRGTDTITETQISLMGDIVGSFVGTPTAANFTGYLAVGSKLPRPQDIVSGKAKAQKFELHEAFFISCGVLAHLSEHRKHVEMKEGTNYCMDDKFTKAVDNTLHFVQDNFDAEVLASFITRFVGREAYSFSFNPTSAIQKQFARWVFGGASGEARLIYAN